MLRHSGRKGDYRGLCADIGMCTYLSTMTVMANQLAIGARHEIRDPWSPVRPRSVRWVEETSSTKRLGLWRPVWLVLDGPVQPCGKAAFSNSPAQEKG